jgi:hypothetical protein
MLYCINESLAWRRQAKTLELLSRRHLHQVNMVYSYVNRFYS